MFRHVVILLFLFVAWIPASRAQESADEQLVLSLRDALERADAANFSIARSSAEDRVADAEVHMARAAFLPQVTVSNAFSTTTDPLNAFGFKLKQEIVTPDDFDPNTLNDPDRIDNFSMRLEVRQPVVNPAGLMERNAARFHADAAAESTVRTRHAVAYEVKRSYFSLVVARSNVAVLDSALASARQNRDQTVEFYEQGLISRADLLQADVHVLDLEAQHTRALSIVQNASDRLRYLLRMESPVEIVPADGLNPVQSNGLVPESFDADRSRSDLRALQKTMEANAALVRARRVQLLPRLDAVGAFEFNDNRFPGTGAQNWGIGAVLTWNPFSGYRQLGSVERARAELRKSELIYEDARFERDVQIAEARRGLADSFRRLDLAEAGVEQARESLRIRTDRYREGLEKTTDVLSAEVVLARQRLSRLQSLYDLYASIFRLEFLLEEQLLKL